MLKFFKNKKPSPAEPFVKKAKQFMEKNNIQKCFSTLDQAFNADIYHMPAYEFAVQALTSVNAKKEASLFHNVIHSKDKTQAFKILGNHFLEAENYRLAKTFLGEAFKKKKDLAVGHDLAIAYARKFDTKTAQEILEQISDEFDYWTFWYYTKLKILNNDRREIENHINELEDVTRVEAKNENHQVAIDKAQEVVASYLALLSIDNPAREIKHWHFIQYGAIILDLFDTEVAGGRHVASWGNFEQINGILHAFKKVAEQLSVNIKKIVTTKDRDSLIIGKALSLLLEVPFANLDANASYEDTLFVSAYASSLHEIPFIENIADNNKIFSLVQQWMVPTFVAADVVGLIAQMYTLPWAENNINNKEGIDYQAMSMNEVAEKILKAKPTPTSNFDLDFYTSRKVFLKFTSETGKRSNYTLESPVPGSYFGG